jgi:penicillin-binding protein 1A
VVVLRNSDARILAEAGGRRFYKDRYASYSDYNRVVDSRRQPGSALKPLAYLAAFRGGSDLDTRVPDAPIDVPMGSRPRKWITNYDGKYKGPIPMRQALAESRNAATIWVTKQVGVRQLLRTARDLGMHSRLAPYLTTALGASEVTLLELANLYRAMASGVLAEPYVVDHVTDAGGQELFRGGAPTRPLGGEPHVLRLIQEGLRGVVRLPGGTAHVLDSPAFPIPVMAKTGTTSEFRDALFVGSTYGPEGITVAVRIGYDDNRELGDKETGARAALPVFREVMLSAYGEGLVGPVPRFPDAIERAIDVYLGTRVADAEMAAEPAPEELHAALPVRVLSLAEAPAPALRTRGDEALAAAPTVVEPGSRAKRAPEPGSRD